jgi:hypothetical protein
MPTLRDVGLLGLLAYAGLRPGEALALRWRDVGGVLVVDRAVSDWVIRQTKTNRRRTIEVVAPLAADLDLHRPKVAASDALVCAGGRGQVLDLDNWRSRVWVPACEAAGCGPRPTTAETLCVAPDPRGPRAALRHRGARPCVGDDDARPLRPRLRRGSPRPGGRDARRDRFRPRRPRASRCVPDVYPAPGAGAAITGLNRLAKGKRTTGLEPATFGLGSRRSTS